MVSVDYSCSFERAFKNLKNQAIKTQLKKKIAKIISSPKIGKPMRFSRKGTREIYVPPFRLSYAFIQDRIIFLDLYHKD